MKTCLLFLPFGLDDLDSQYPFNLGFYITEKKNILFNGYILDISKQEKDYYYIPDKINDVIAYWMFFYYLKSNNLLQKNTLLHRPVYSY